jgi:hypothetical protein
MEWDSVKKNPTKPNNYLCKKKKKEEEEEENSK